MPKNDEMDLNLLKKEIIAEEGFRTKPYFCSEGYLTIGYGTNLESRGITKKEAETLLLNDIRNIVIQLDKKLPWLSELPPSKQRVIANMAYQLGVDGLLKFDKMLKYIRKNDYERAAEEALNSLWARQTPARARRIANRLRED